MEYMAPSITPLSLAEVLLIQPERFRDSRGFFSETYSRRSLAEAGITDEFVQDNHSLSAGVGTVRGLHYQLPPFAQAKLVRVTRGSILDVAVDLRQGSPTFGAMSPRLERRRLEPALCPGRLCAWLLHAGAGYRGRLQGHGLL